MKLRTKIRLSVLAALITLSLGTGFFVRPYIVVGDSMSPTLKSWDLCLMQRVRPYEPQRGDIVVFRTADDPPLYFVKRVIALPGETVAIRSGSFAINGTLLSEPYTILNPDWQMKPIPVPPGKLFVVGDHRDLDRELYVQGLVATRLVQARMLWHWRWKK